MAKGKSKRTKYVSNGGQKNVSTKIKWSESDKIMFAADAKIKGKTAYITIRNPNVKETNRLYIRVPA